MNYEFHYYITYIIAQRAGFNPEDSYIIAYSSQQVDDNSIKFTINKGKSNQYINYISQTNNIIKPKKKLMRIYPCFHFVPGEYDSSTAKRKDGKMHILTTTPNSSNVNKLLDEALGSGDLYRIGIATHSYADSWAHQNFVGYFDYFNGIGGVLEFLTPNIGHVDARFLPDIPVYLWPDSRSISKNKTINNKKRFIEAAKNLFKKYSLHFKNPISEKEIAAKWEILKKDIEKAIGDEIQHDKKDKNKKKRLLNYRKLIKDYQDYDKKSWFKKAVKRKIVGLPDFLQYDILNKIKIFPDRYHKKTGFENSHWFKFQEAVKEHQKFALDLMKNIFNQLEIEEF